MLERSSKTRVSIVLGVVGSLWGVGQAIAQPVLIFEALPELPGGASEVFGLGGTDDSQDNTVRISDFVGRSLDDDGLWKAVVWSRAANGILVVDELPNPNGDAESTAFKATGTGRTTGHVVSLSVGSADDLGGIAKPVLWSGFATAPDSLDWTAQLLPLPPGAMGGVALSDPRCSGPCETCRCSIGGITEDAGELTKASLWTSDPLGLLWSVELLSDFGPGFSSEATSAAVDPVDPLDADDDLLVIGGSVQTATSPQAPCVWQELAGGGFERVDLLMAPGAYRGSVFAAVLGKLAGNFDLYSVGHNATVAGLADLYRGVLYERVDGVWGAPLVLPPIPGLRDSKATGVFLETPEDTGVLIVVGYSYTELSPGSERATLWRVAPDSSVTTYNLNDTIPNLPPDTTLGFLFGCMVHLPVNVGGAIVSIFGTYTEESPLAGPGPVPHAFVLASPPAGIPTMSEWGLAVMALLLVLAAGSIMRRRTTRAVAQ